MKKPLSATSLHELSDGLVGLTIDQAIREVYTDLDQRGSDGQPRKINIELVFKPEDSVITINAQVKTTLPPQRPPVTIAKFNHIKSAIEFSPEVPENPDQGSFADLNGREAD